MNIMETSQVLARIQAYHGGFEVTKEKVAAWFELLEPYEYRDCLNAVKDYFRAPGDWIMPSDVISRVKEYRNERTLSLNREILLTEADEKTAIEDGTYGQKMRHLRRLVADGHVTATQFDAYQDGAISIEGLTPRKEIGR